MGRGRVVWMMEKNAWYQTWVDMRDPTMTSALEAAYQHGKTEIWQITKDTKYFDLDGTSTMKFHFARPIRRTFVYSGQEVMNAVCEDAVCDNSITELTNMSA